MPDLAASTPGAICGFGLSDWGVVGAGTGFAGWIMGSGWTVPDSGFCCCTGAADGGAIGLGWEVSGGGAGASSLRGSGPVVGPGKACPSAGVGAFGPGGSDPGISGSDLGVSLGCPGFGDVDWVTGTFGLETSGFVVGWPGLEPWDADGFGAVSVCFGPVCGAAVWRMAELGLGFATDPLTGSDGRPTVRDEVPGLDGESRFVPTPASVTSSAA